MHLVADRSDDGKRLDNFLREKLATVSLGAIQKLLRKNGVLINGAPADRSSRLSRGDRVELALEPPQAVAPSRSVRFGVLYVDDDVVVVDKPAGLVVHPGPQHRADTLLNGLFARWGADLAGLGPERGYGIVHRLDRGTSGLMVVARSCAAYDHLLNQFARRRVRKTYLALVLGNPPRSGRIEQTIGRRNSSGRTRMISAGGAHKKRAVTDFEVIELIRNYALLKVHPLTGRMHQIRVHLAAKRFPILGDDEYGNPTPNRMAREKLGLARPFLHAAELEFIHPKTAREVKFASALPKDLQRALELLRKGENRLR